MRLTDCIIWVKSKQPTVYEIKEWHSLSPFQNADITETAIKRLEKWQKFDYPLRKLLR